MNKERIEKELQYKAVRSSGAGGQNVNKVSTKVLLQFHVTNSQGLNEDQKQIISEKLANRISKEGYITLESDETRSQLKNKQLVTQRFFMMLRLALKKDKQRIATKIPKAVIKKRLNDKRLLGEKKQNRKFRF